MYVHAHDKVHQVDRLINRLEARRAGPDEFRDLLEAQVPIHCRTGVIRSLDRAFFERGEHFAAGQQRGLGAGRSEAFGDHPAGHAQLQILEVFDGANRLLRVDDVGAVVDAIDVVESLFGKDLAGNLEAVLAVKEHVPLVRITQPHQVRGQERGRRQLACPVQRERIHRFQHAVLDAVDQFEIADDFLGRERLEIELAAGLFLDRPAPSLECL